MRLKLSRTAAVASLAALASGCVGELTDEERTLIGTFAVNSAGRLPNQSESAPGATNAGPPAPPSAVPSALPPAVPSALPPAVPSALPPAVPSALPPAVPSALPPAVPSAVPAECADVQSSVLTMPGKCGGANCHGAGSALGDFSVALDALVDAPSLAAGACAGHLYIDSANPGQSLILTKLGAGHPCGLPMPIGAPLTANEHTCLRAWVAGVAAGERP